MNKDLSNRSVRISSELFRNRELRREEKRIDVG